MNINQKIQEFLTEHQYQKKRRIFTAVLSLMFKKDKELWM